MIERRALRIRATWLLGLFLLLMGGSSAEAPKRIVVDLTHQIAIAYQDGRVLFYGRVSTGKPGRRTPTGSFHVREKDIKNKICWIDIKFLSKT